jgi:hypothetical protein
MVHNATGLSSPAYDVLQSIGEGSLVLAVVTFLITIVRSIAHAAHRSAVR